jgi:hypothetical protein
MKLLIATFLTGVLACKIYRRRRPAPPAPKAPKVQEKDFPKEHQLELCRLYDAWKNAKGSSTKEKYEMFNHIRLSLGDTWPDGYAAEVIWARQIPRIKFTERLGESK